MLAFIKILVLLLSLASGLIGAVKTGESYRSFHASQIAESEAKDRVQALSHQGDETGAREAKADIVSARDAAPDAATWTTSILPIVLGLLGMWFTATKQTTLAEIVGRISAYLNSGQSADPVTPSVPMNGASLLTAIDLLVTAGKPLTYRTEIDGHVITVAVSTSAQASTVGDGINPSALGVAS